MKMKELKELDVKALAEKLESEKAQLNQLKLNHSVAPLEIHHRLRQLVVMLHVSKQNFVRENLINNNGSDGNKKFKKSKTGCCCHATRWIKPLL